jgi:hypothetical protein
MKNRFQVLAALILGLAGMLAYVGSSSAAPGDPCVGTTCGLGGQQRAQIGVGLPIPITTLPAQTGLITSHPGAIAATPNATIMQTTGPAPRKLTLAPGRFAYDEPPLQIGLFQANSALFAVSTNLSVQNPRSVAMLSAGGRPGPAIVSWCAGSPAPTGTFNPGCLGPNTTFSLGQPATNGFVRYEATRNQFGGIAGGTSIGTVQILFNAGGLAAADLPCNGGPGCLVAISQATPGTAAVFGQNFGVTVMNPPDLNPTGFRTAVIQPNGSLVFGNPVPATAFSTPVDVDGNGFQDFLGQGATSWGFPLTTGQLKISVTAALGDDEIFIRTGVDGRNANGSGIVTLVSGTVSSRTLSGPNANRGWITLKIPEPGVLAAGSSALLMLAGCHWLARRRQS